MGRSLQASLALLGQFDLSDGDKLHSQYAVGKLSLPINAFLFDLGACFELLQSPSMETAFAAEAGVSYVLPTTLRNKVSLFARYSSGNSGGTMSAFQPFTITGQGNILDAKLSALSIITLDYIAKLNKAFSAGLTSSYFIRNDLKTFSSYPVSGGGGGNLLGNEFFARLLWSPVSDLYFSLGGGVFLPSMGDAAPNADNAWRVELNVIISM